MQDKYKTKEQLIGELLGLRRQVAEAWPSDAGDVPAEKATELDIQSIFDSLVEHVVYRDLHMKVLWANRAACLSAGMTREELLGRHCYEIWAQRSDPCEDCPIKKVWETGKPHATEKATPDGRWWFIQASPVRGSNGDIVGTANYTLEITERKRAEKALLNARNELERRVEERTAELTRANAQLRQEVEERKRVEKALWLKDRAIESSINAIAFAEFGGNLTYVNRSFRELWGYTDDQEILGRPAVEFWESQGEASEVLRSLGRRGTWIGELVARRKDGSVFDAQVSASVIPDHAGEPRYMMASFVDVTERKRTEEALRESEQRFRTAFNNAAIGMSLVADNGYFLKVNRALCNILGYSAQELVQKTWVEITSPVDLEGCYEWLQEVKKGAAGTYEKRFIHKMGHPVWVSVGTSMVPDARGKPLYYISLFQDITERKRAEEALRESEQTMKAILAASPVGICLARNRILDWANRAMYRIWGYPEGSLLGESAEILYPSREEYERVGREFYSAIEKGGIGRIETQWITGDGRIIDCYLQGSSLDAGDLSGGVIVAATDMTERKQIEKALRESESRYRFLAENITDVIWTMDMDLRFTYESPSVMQLRGYTVEEAMAQGPEDILTPASLQVARRAFAEELARKQEHDASRQRTLELELKCKDGSTVWTEVKTKILFDPEGQPTGILGVSRDITERKRAEEKLHTYQEQLRSLVSELLLTEEREKRRLATDLHDSIAQALAISKLKLDVLCSEPLTDTASRELREVRDYIARAVQQTQSLTFELSPPVLYELGLEAALEYLADQMEKQYGIVTEFEDDGELKPVGENLRVLLFRAVQELLVNVVKHAEAREVRLAIGKDDEAIRIVVADNGIGFDTSEIDPYAGKTGRFGLFSIGERLRQLGGHFEIISTPRNGTRATLRAPLERGKTPPATPC
ncbi:MAG: PAS domain S-box protein [Syntrophobacteria bacterium]